MHEFHISYYWTFFQVAEMKSLAFFLLKKYNINIDIKYFYYLKSVLKTYHDTYLPPRPQICSLVDPNTDTQDYYNQLDIEGRL